MGEVLSTIGRVVLAVGTGGISELIRAMTPEQQAQYNTASQAVDEIKQEEEKARESLRKEQEALKEQIAKNNEVMAKETEKAEGLKKDNELLQKQLNGKLDDYSSRMAGLFDRQLKAVAKLPDVAKTPVFSTALLGKTSSGKTTTINKAFGTTEKTSPIRCTPGVTKVFQDETIQVFDVFGDNDEESYHRTEILVQAKQLHKLIIVYTESVDGILNMARLMTALRVPLIFFRNKCEDLNADDLKLVYDNDTAMLQKVTKQEVNLIVGSAKTNLNIDKLKADLRR
jgi:hypothetical protein